MERTERIVLKGREEEPQVIRYVMADPQKKGTLERLQETVIEKTVNQYELEDRRQIDSVMRFMERNPDISYVEYESNPVFRIDLTITRRGLIFRREEATISATITPNRRFRAQR
ncbi:hypothetical protein GCM10007108_02850 [Thermogymnomonas acidicola]|uniref:Uncharacterized protein n=2 Tax=Thermogymnomonas acidicola TaxID=399579 RepID=A0AA37F8U1_9ARCH|nr:hypothetical protein [Thermogymnomonas acidicola]GGM68208.1 hypothetical protein GCM10007108_02850 [Thermogymnomonas acidicola]